MNKAIQARLAQLEVARKASEPAEKLWPDDASDVIANDMVDDAFRAGISEGIYKHTDGEVFNQRVIALRQRMNEGTTTEADQRLFDSIPQDALDTLVRWHYKDGYSITDVVEYYYLKATRQW